MSATANTHTADVEAAAAAPVMCEASPVAKRSSSSRWALAAALLGCAALAVGAVGTATVAYHRRTATSNSSSSHERSLDNSSGMTLGVTIQDTPLSEWSKQLGVTVRTALMYEEIQRTKTMVDSIQAQVAVKDSQPPIMVLQICADETCPRSTPTLASINGGGFDTQLHDLGARLAKVQGQVVLRPMHEFNARWYPWGTSLAGQTIDQYKQAFARILNIIKVQEKATNVLFELAYNNQSIDKDGSPMSNKAFPFSLWMPSGGIVDRVCASVYDFTGKASFQDLAQDAIAQMQLAAPGKPVGICESSTVQGDKDAWFAAAVKFAASVGVSSFNCFFINKSDGSFNLNGSSTSKFAAAWRAQGGK